MPQPTDPSDPKGLIRESYRIDRIGPQECRSIFLDWALSLPVGGDAQAAIGNLLAQYGDDSPDHPMTAVLREGSAEMPSHGRRGGRSGGRRS